MTTQETLLEFPCRFPIKVMGVRTDEFSQIIFEIALKHAPDFTHADLDMKVSRNGNYLSLTCTINAQSREQLDNLYREFTGHPLVKWVL